MVSQKKLTFSNDQLIGIGFSRRKKRFIRIGGIAFLMSLTFVVGTHASDGDIYDDNKQKQVGVYNASLEKRGKEKDVNSQLPPLPKVLLKTQEDWFNWEETEAEERKQQEIWNQQQSTFTVYNTTVGAASVIAAMETLGLDERPLAFGQRAYIEHPNGVMSFSSYNSSYKHHADSLQVKDFGLSSTRVGYVAKDNEEHRETFTPTRPKGKTYKASRNHPFSAFSLTFQGEQIDFDAGHGIDQADTVVANGRNSSTDPDNFVPQNRYYNQKIRNHIVNHATRSPSGSYKEISVYDMADPLIYNLSNGEKCHIPIGFIFVIFKDHKVKKTFYFPNLISYEKLVNQYNIEANYRKFMDYFEISQDAASNGAVKLGDTDGHTRAVNNHAEKGYRSLSGRFDVVGHIKMPNPAKAALRRLLAIYHMEQAAHLEFRCVENKAQLVDIFTRQMKYYALDKATDQEEKERDRAYWQAYEDEEQKLASDGIAVNMIDYAISFKNLTLRLNGMIPEDDPRELALKRIQNPSPGA